MKIESGLYTGLPAVDVNALASDSSRLYVGTEIGLFILEKSNWSASEPLTYRQGLPDDYVLALERVDRSLYVGTASGLCRLDLDTDSVYQIRPDTFRRHIIYDMEPVDQTLWIASSAGAFRYTPDSDRLQQFRDKNMVITGSALNVEHHDGDIWFATDAGAVRLDLATGVSESFDEPHIQPDHRALAVNDWILALSSGRGLTFIFWTEEKTRSWEFEKADGLASETILTLHFDGDYLWVGTDDGLTRFMWDNPLWLD
jgi:ligand-binding sensor domain-containing protein